MRIAKLAAACGFAICTSSSQSCSMAAWRRQQHTWASPSLPFPRSSQASKAHWAYGCSTERPKVSNPRFMGDALLKRGLAAFDELKQGIRDIAFLSDPTSGELRIGCGQATSIAFLSSLLRRILQDLSSGRRSSDRRYRRQGRIWRAYESARLISCSDTWVMPVPSGSVGDDLNIEFLFDDPLVAVAGMQSPWARRRKIGLAELVDAPWILSPSHTTTYSITEQAFRAKGLGMPQARLVTSSLHVRADLVAKESYITTFPRSLAERYLLKVLPVDLAVAPWPVSIITLKNRTLNPLVELFVEHLRNSSSHL